MSKREGATRAALVEAAAALYAGADLPSWEYSEYMRGMCELIADTTGAEVPEYGRDEAWEEIDAAHRRAAGAIRAARERRALDVAALSLREAYSYYDREGGDEWTADALASAAREMLAALAEGEGEA